MSGLVERKVEIQCDNILERCTVPMKGKYPCVGVEGWYMCTKVAVGKPGNQTESRRESKGKGGSIRLP